MMAGDEEWEDDEEETEEAVFTGRPGEAKSPYVFQISRTYYSAFEKTEKERRKQGKKTL